jgi:phosphoenolpyruvate-protein phosphotransferase (PTS system enzyme I)
VTDSVSSMRAIPRLVVELDGIAGSPGLSIGPALVVEVRRPGVVKRRLVKHQAAEEVERYQQAIERAARELEEVASRATGGHIETSVLQAYVLMVQDQTLRDNVERRILVDLVCAEWALDLAVDEIAAHLAQAPDPYLSERSHDVRFVGDRILAVLLGQHSIVSLPDTGEPFVIVAHDLSPAETAALSPDRVLALVTEVGTRTSHTAIVARALEIPAVVGAVGAVGRIGNGDTVIVDGLRGRVIVSPSEEMLETSRRRAERYRALTSELRALHDRPATTRCGIHIHLRANIELPTEVDGALAHGAEGIGLYRTEFLYVDRPEPPTEDEQYAVYRRVVETVAPLPVTLRTFDIGGDKLAPSLHGLAGLNPALGVRAIRLGLAIPELLLTQLRAMVRASAHGRVQILIPMVSTVGEFRAVQRLVYQAMDDIDARGLPRAAFIPCGCMIEVPSAAMMADELAREAAFLSIGTNDLVQYTLAVDRGRRELVALASPFDPAVLRLIRRTARAGERHNRRVLACGAMASDPLAVLLLLGMGLRELSMEGAAIPELKEAISRVSMQELEQLADAALASATAEEVERMVTEGYAPCFADLLDGAPAFEPDPSRAPSGLR